MANNREDKRRDRHAMAERFVVCGLHPVEEALETIPGEVLRSGRIFVSDTRQTKDLGKIYRLCDELSLKPDEVSISVLNRKAGETRHQGVVLELPEFQYADLDGILDGMSAQPLILVLDQIQDPHNLGAIIRSAAAFGADGVIIPRDRAAQITATSIKTSAGQAYRVPICRVSNIAQTLRELDEGGFNIVGADIEGDAVDAVDFHRATVLVMGSDGQGMRRLTRTFCHQMVRIPQNPAVESLNVSVATAILLYTASRQRTLPW